MPLRRAGARVRVGVGRLSGDCACDEGVGGA